MSKLLFIFLDGVGVGPNDKNNPFFFLKSDYLPFYVNGTLPDGTPIKPIDANLGVSGLPQSATGQTSLFTGQNLSKILGKHIGGFPNKLMRSFLYKHNLLKQLRTTKKHSVFINAYPLHDDYFSSKHLQLFENGAFYFSDDFPEKFKRRISVSSCLLLSCKMKPFNEKHIANKTALFQDYSNSYLKKRGMKINLFTPETAADILMNKTHKSDFILYEYFQTDIYAHRKSFTEQIELIKNFNTLIKRIILKINPNDTTLLITSDHGNLEDTTTNQHTRNPVPLLTWGEKSIELRESINSITDVTPAILDIFN